MRYVHRFKVNAPLADVAEFHSQSQSMAQITPPPIQVRMQMAPERLYPGAVMSFTLGVGPVRLPWQAQITHVGPTGFIDKQLRGPFSKWEHRHIFVPISQDSTLVLDVVEVELSRSPMKRALGAMMWLNMPVLFAYRAWMSKRILTSAKSGTKTADTCSSSAT